MEALLLVGSAAGRQQQTRPAQKSAAQTMRSSSFVGLVLMASNGNQLSARGNQWRAASM
jgi:hypothetical protein